MDFPTAAVASPVLAATEAGDWKSYPAVLVGSIWDEDDLATSYHIPAAAAAASEGVRDLESIRKSKLEAKRRTAYERSHFALVGRPAPTVITYRSHKKPVPAPPAPTEAPGRVLRNLYISQVGRFQFRLIHRMEGRWNGETTVICPGQEPDVRVVSTELVFMAKEGRWRERQSLTDSSGLTSTQLFQYIPTGDGSLTVTSDDPYLSEAVDMRLTEHSEHVLILTAISHETAKPLIVETVTVVDNLRRVRTVQRFDESGQFKCLYLVKESRVIDAVSGAVEEFHEQ